MVGKLCERPIELEEFPEESRSLSFGVMVIGVCLCWMCKNPIGRDDTKESRIWVLYRDWRTKISKKILEGQVGGGDVGGIEGL